jgi:16S rRNA (adenine1518-N6/adenine1519-N6)-dimethyltransferase
MQLFERHGMHPRSDLGQNFLIDLNLLEYVVEQAELGPDDVVLEIGAGTGGMTGLLAQRAAQVIAFEIDPRVHGLAQASLSKLSNVTLVQADALKDKNHFSPLLLEAVGSALSAAPGRGLKLVANLPYCVATPVISNLVASDLPWRSMVVTIQWEMAERLRATSTSDHYGAVSVWVQSQCAVSVLKRLSPAVFWPRPQVESAIVRILPNLEARSRMADREFFHDFIRRLFQQRRKRLRGVLAVMYRQELSKLVLDETLAPFSFSEGVRAEELSPGILVSLGEALRSRLEQSSSR